MPVFTSASFWYDFPQSTGATVNIEIPFSSRIIFRNKKNKEKEKFREGVTVSNIGFYRYPFNHSGLLAQQSVGFRYHKTKPYYFQWQVVVGALRTFYDGTVYSVSNNGSVNTLQHFGRWYAITGFAAAFGHDWQRSIKPKPFAVSLQSTLWMQYPYNSFLLPHLSIQVAFDYHFKNIHTSIKQKQVMRNQGQ